MFLEHHENTDKLPGVKLPDSVEYTTDLKQAVEGAKLMVMAVPSPAVRATARNMKGIIQKGQIIVDVAKGIEESSLKTMSQVIEDELPEANVAVLSGPSHAEEVGRGLPTTIVAGAHDIDTAKYIQVMFMSPVFRVYTSTDKLGIEVGSAL